VRTTGEIGPILLRRTEKDPPIGPPGIRLRRPRRDAGPAGLRSPLEDRAALLAPLDEVAPLVATQLETAKAGEKARRKLELDLAAYQGKELYTTTEPGADGIRRALQHRDRGNLEDLRAVAQNFTAQGKSVYIATLKDPPSVLLAASPDSGIDAGKLLKSASTKPEGRGGGNARIAQGSVPDAAALDTLIAGLPA
jgi:alanyl-tRNA synthetase